MFATMFGEELLGLMKLVFPGRRIGLAELVDLYLWLDPDQELSDLNDVPGTGDLMTLVRQKCEESGVSDLVGFLRLTVPLFVRDEALLRKSFNGLSARQISQRVHAITSLCKIENLPFLRKVRLGNAEALEIFKKQIGETDIGRDWLRTAVKAMLREGWRLRPLCLAQVSLS